MTDSGPRVLVVDDEPAIRRFLRTSLSAHGYAISDAASGREALWAAAAQRPDLVILDLGLPDMDGIAARSPSVRRTCVLLWAIDR